MEPKQLWKLQPRVGIDGVGNCIPPLILTNKDLEEMINTSDEWIKEHVGIEERRIASEHYNVYTMGAAALLQSIKNGGIEKNQVDAIIVAHNYTDELTVPSAACVIQYLAGLDKNKVSAMDVVAGCSGGLYALDAAIDKMYSTYFANRRKDLNVMVIAVDKLSNVVNWKDRNTCILLSDGAAAQRLRFFDEGGFLSSYTEADGSLGNTISYRSGYKHQLIGNYKNQLEGKEPIKFSNEQAIERQFFKMDGKAVYKFAVRKMPEVAKKVWEAAGFKLEDLNKIVKKLIPHQANWYIDVAAAERLGIDLDKVYLEGIKFQGNTSGASVPISYNNEYMNGKLEKGDIVLKVAFGAGTTAAGVVYQCNQPRFQGIKEDAHKDQVEDLYDKYKFYTKNI